MNLRLSTDRTAKLTVSLELIRKDLTEVLPVLELFPERDTLINEQAKVYRWKLKPIGTMGMTHVVEFVADYTTSDNNQTLSFEAVPGQGNAGLSGQFKFTGQDGDITAQVLIKGELRDVNVPSLLRSKAGSLVQGIFDTLAQRFLDNLQAKYAASAPG
ncbi:MAG: hypothetical protein ACK5NY_07520 [Burkholderiaceae bacterium]